MSQSRYWCLTLNNPTVEDQVDPPPYDYFIMGREVGESGTPHMQGFIVLKKLTRLPELRKWLPRAHFEVMGRFSTPQKAADYCKKDGDFHEDGTLPDSRGKPGGMARKAQYEEAYSLAKQGKFSEVDPEMALKHKSGLLWVHSLHNKATPLESGKKHGIWIYGPPGIGKTTKYRTQFPDAYLKNLSKWWDGYSDQETVIMDDIDPTHHFMAHHLKHWGDEHPFQAESKGSIRVIRPKLFIITSNYHPNAIFSHDEDVQAILRRFELIHMTSRT